jgi:hypothetical protein
MVAALLASTPALASPKDGKAPAAHPPAAASAKTPEKKDPPQKDSSPSSKSDVAKKIAQLLKSQPGLRAAQIQSALGLGAKDTADGLKSGVDGKVLTSSGTGDATTYVAK